MNKKAPREKHPRPVNNNVIVRLLDSNPTNEFVMSGGIVVPAGATAETRTQLVEIVAVSPDIFVGQCWTCRVSPGDKALIHRGVQGTPIEYEGQKFLVIGYVNLICILP